MAESGKEAYCPTVLIVDDDKGFTEYWRKMFHDETSVGVVVANSLDEGRRLVSEVNLPIDGIVADMFFDYGTDDPDYELFDGLDLLDYSQRERPDTRRYVLSFYAVDDHYRERAKQRGIGVERWFEKKWQPAPDSPLPWVEVELDLMKRRLAPVDPEATIEERTKHAQQLAPLPMRTYLQSLGPHEQRLRIVQPIEVICMKEKNGTVRATAQRLALLQEARGMSVEDALAELQTIIRDHVELFLEEPDETVVGYAKRVKENLNTFIEVQHTHRRSGK